MKYRTALPLILLPQLVLGVSFTTTENDDSWSETKQQSTKDETVDRLSYLYNLSELFSGLGVDRKTEALKTAAQSIEDVLGRTPSKYC
jgi:hypothetical protein